MALPPALRPSETFLSLNKLTERVATRLAGLDVDDVQALTSAGAEIRGWIEAAPLPKELEEGIAAAIAALEAEAGGTVSWAVRSSATAEDMHDASFAGQQKPTSISLACRPFLTPSAAFCQPLQRSCHCLPRAYRLRRHSGGAVGRHSADGSLRQRCSRRDVHPDTESGFRDAVFVTSSYGLGEMVVQGAVNPDEFYVFKPALRKAPGHPAAARWAADAEDGVWQRSQGW